MKPGIYPDMSDKEYRALPAISQSALRYFAECPRKFKLAPKKEPTAAMLHGSLVDELWLRRSTLACAPYAADAKPVNGYIVQPALYAGKDGEKPWSNNATFCKSWNETWELQKLTVVSADQYAKAVAAVKRLDGEPALAATRARCKTQVAMVWEWEGELCKGLVDMLDEEAGEMGDLKCSAYHNEEAWASTIYDQGLHIQAAFYMDGYEAITGKKIERWFHVVSEPSDPFEPAGPVMHPDFTYMGKSRWRSLFRDFVVCRETNIWPGYDLNAVVKPAAWMMKKEAA
jgi:hypothetical protein